jgi:2-methylcitrate dehydratase PrpD
MAESSFSGSLSRNMAEWVSGLSWSQIPREVVEDTKMRILDIIGVMLGGKELPIVSNVRHAVRESGGRGAGIIGFSEQATLANAALVHGVMSTALEFDDTHLDGPVHSTGPVVSAAFPMAAKLAISGKQLIEAVAVGNELSCRLGQVAPGMFHKCGFQATGAFGIFGAVYSLGKVLALPSARIVDAIGIGGSMSASCMASFEDGTSPKSLHVGLDASSAVQAISFAQHGMSGPAVVFDGRFGFFRSHVQIKDYDFQFDALLRHLGADWEALDILSKAYPCGYQIHPFLDAAMTLRTEHRIDPDAISEIVCFVADDPIHALTCEPAAEKVRPNNTWHARISLQHSIAEALVTGKLDKTAYSETNLRHPRINALADRVKCMIDSHAASDPNTPIGEVRFRLHDGTKLSRRVVHMRGSRQNPMTIDDFLTKFRSNSADVIPSSLLDQTIERIVKLQDVANVAEVFNPLYK